MSETIGECTRVGGRWKDMREKHNLRAFHEITKSQILGFTILTPKGGLKQQTAIITLLQHPEISRTRFEVTFMHC
jgi:hypothetical protein